MTARHPLVLAGDLLVLLAFAVVGRRSHEEAAGLEAALAVGTTAAPFVIGWLVASVVPSLRTSALNVRALLLEAARMWLVAYPVAVLVRATVLGRFSPLSFYLVAFGSALIMLLAWRLVVATVLTARRATA